MAKFAKFTNMHKFLIVSVRHMYSVAYMHLYLHLMLLLVIWPISIFSWTYVISKCSSLCTCIKLNNCCFLCVLHSCTCRTFSSSLRIYMYMCMYMYCTFILYCVGDIKSTASVTNLVVTQEIIVAQGWCAYTCTCKYIELPLPVHDCLAWHPAVAVVRNYTM